MWARRGFGSDYATILLPSNAHHRKHEWSSVYYIHGFFLFNLWDIERWPLNSSTLTVHYLSFFSFSVGHSSWINVRGQKLPLSLVIFLNNLWLPNIDIHQLDCKDSVRIMMWICREGWLMLDLAVFFSGSVLSPSWIQVSFILIEGALSPSWIQVFFIPIEGVCLGLGEFYGL